MSRTIADRRGCRAAAAALAAIAGCSLLLSSFSSEGSGDIQGAKFLKGAFRVQTFSTAGQRMLDATTGAEHVGTTDDQTFRHIYLCGIAPNMAMTLFPEYNGTFTSVLGFKDYTYVETEPTEDDLLLSMHSLDQARCAKPLGRKLRGQILLFPGKMMFFNTEAADTQGGPRPLGGSLVRAPRDRCSPGYVSCIDLQGTNASRAVEYEQPGGRFNFLPPSDRAYFFGPHPDSERSLRLPLLSQQFLKGDFGEADDDGPFGKIRDPDRKPRNTGEHFVVFLASHCVPFRDEAAKTIAQLGEVHVGRKWMQRCAENVPDPKEGPTPRLVVESGGTSAGDWSRNSEIMSRYKFALVMENTYRDGYVTEKLLNAYRSGAVPIWYGGRWALNVFNPEAMVFYDVEDPEPALERIAFLSEHPDEYEKVLRAPILRDGERTVEEYFSVDDNIGGGKLKNRIRRLVGLDRVTERQQGSEVEIKSA